MPRLPPDPAGRPVGVYVHFPWCVRRCPYCDFNVHRSSAPPHRRYADAVLAELDARAAALDGTLVSVFFGGGSPSLWEPGELGRCRRAVVARAGALATAGVEVTVEANPDEAFPDRLAALAEVGVDRLSLGVQSFDDAVLSALGRLHDGARAMEGLRAALAAGFERVSVDLIYGVPGQTMASWRDTLARVVDLGVTHVSAYALTVEAGTPLARDVRDGLCRMPADGPTLDMMAAADEALSGAGLRRYEVSNHARPGHESRHNLLYWTGAAYLGLGAGAHSHLPAVGGGQRSWNLRRPADYMARALDGGVATEGSEALSPEQVWQERLLMGLRLYEGVRLADLEAATGGAVPEAVLAAARRLAAEGLVTLADGHLRATVSGLPVLDAVVAALV